MIQRPAAWPSLVPLPIRKSKADWHHGAARARRTHKEARISPRTRTQSALSSRLEKGPTNQRTTDHKAPYSPWHCPCLLRTRDTSLPGTHPLGLSSPQNHCQCPPEPLCCPHLSSSPLVPLGKQGGGRTFHGHHQARCFPGSGLWTMWGSSSELAASLSTCTPQLPGCPMGHGAFNLIVFPPTMGTALPPHRRR